MTRIKIKFKNQNGFSRAKNCTGFLEHNGTQWTEKGAPTSDKPHFILVDCFTLMYYYADFYS